MQSCVSFFSSEEEEEEEEETEEDSDTEVDEPVVNGKDDDEGVPLSTLAKDPVPCNRWHLVCQTLEDWEALAESFKESKVRCEKTMYRTITEDFLPEIPRILEEKVGFMFSSPAYVLLAGLLMCYDINGTG